MKTEVKVDGRINDVMEATRNKYFHMDLMFGGCKSLNNLPDISKWDIHNA